MARRTYIALTNSLALIAFAVVLVVTAAQAPTDTSYGVAPGHGTWLRGDAPTAQDRYTAKACNARAHYTISDADLARWLVQHQGATHAQAQAAVDAPCT